MSGDYSAQWDSIAVHLRTAPGMDRLRARVGDGLLEDDTVSAVLKEAGRFAADVLAPLNRSIDHAGCELRDGRVLLAPGYAEAWAAFREGGWTGIDLPLEYGGQGLASVLGVAVQELFDRGCVAFGMVPGAARAAARLIESHAEPQIRNEWLPNLVSGEWGATICMSEPDAGSDVSRVRTRASIADDGSWRVYGEKMWISFGDHSLVARIGHVVLARTDPSQPGARGLSLILVPVDDAVGARNGVIIRRVEEKLGLHGSPTCAIGFDGARGMLIGTAGRGLAQLFRMITVMRLQVGAQGLGLATAAFETARAYANERRQGGAPEGAAVPIIRHRDIQRNLLEMASRIETLRGLLYAAAIHADLAEMDSEPAEAAEAAALLGWLLPIVKNSAAETAFEIAAQAALVLGGAGYSEEWPIAQYLRDARILAIYEGTTGMQAIDLVKRRLLATNSGYDVFVARAILSLTGLPAKEAAALSRALGALEEAARWLRDPRRTRDEIDASVVPMLSLATSVAHCWMGARLVTLRKDGPSGSRLAACGSWALAKGAQDADGMVQAVMHTSARLDSCACAIL
jgi:alkylation response protein AidB-like acyl-CoA dehydrogenase